MNQQIIVEYRFIMRRLVRSVLTVVATLLLFQTAAAQGLPAGRPEEAGFSSERLARIRPAMQAYVDEKKFAGIATLIVRRGKIIYADQVGMMDLDGGKAMSRDTILRIYSMSKPIVSVGIMMLCDAGKLRLDDPVSRYIPAFESVKVYHNDKEGEAQLQAASHPITIRHLLMHTAGLTYGVFGDTPVDKLYQKADLFKAPTLEEFVARVARLPLLFEPGSAWNYGMATDILGRVIEVVSGKTLDQFLSQKIFEPLGMRDTAFEVPAEKQGRVSRLYTFENGKFKAVESGPGRLFPFLSGGGGLFSTLDDYAEFSQMLLNGGKLGRARLLRPETVALMTRNYLPKEQIPIRVGKIVFEGYGFGLGFGVRAVPPKSNVEESLGTYKWAGAANTFFWIDPKEKLIGLVMTQLFPFYAHPVDQDFLRLVYGALERRYATP